MAIGSDALRGPLPRRRGAAGRSPSPLQVGSLLLLLILMAVAGSLIFTRLFGDGRTEAPDYSTQTVGRGTAASSVSATGTVSPTKQIKLTFPTAGQVQEVSVKQGDRVQEGQPLAALNPLPLEIKRDQARTNLATQQLKLQALLNGPTNADIAAAQQTVATAQSTQTKAQNDLFNLLSGASPDEVAQVRAALDRAQTALNVAQQSYDKLVNGTDLTLRPEYATLQTARTAYQTAATAYATKTAPANPLDVSTARSAVTTAQSSLDSARAKLDALQKGADPLDVANARNQVTAAESGLTAAREKLRQTEAGQSKGDIASLQSQVASAQSALTAARAKLQQASSPNTSGDIAAAQAAVNSAQAALNAARAKLTEAQTGTGSAGTADVNAAQAQLNSALAAQSAAVAQFGACAGSAASCTPASGQTPQQAQLDARSKLAQAEAALASARSALARAQAAASPSSSNVLSAQQAVSAAEAQLTAAQNTLQKALQPATPADVTAAQQGVSSAEAALTTAQNNLSKAQAGPTQADVTAARQGVGAAETTLKNAQNALAKLSQPPSPADLSTAQQAVTTAEGQHRGAQNSLDKLLAGAPQDEIAQARVALEGAKSALDTAQTNWDRLVSGADLGTRAETTALAQAKADHQTALTAYNLKTSPPKPGDVEVAQALVDSANASLTSALAKLAQVMGGSLPTEIGQAREATTNAELALKQAQQDLDNTTIKAPFAGTVVAVGVQPGDQAAANTAAVTLLDPDLVRIDANVDETSVAKLRAGQTVRVTFDSLPGRQFSGQVAVVTPAGTAQQGVVSFPISIVFNAQGTTIPPGATATAAIVTEQKENVIAVPSRAIQRNGPQASVDVVLPDGRLENRPVRTGLSGDGGTVEILSGLNEGDKVAIANPTQRAGGSQGSAGGQAVPKGGDIQFFGPAGGGGGAAPAQRVVIGGP